MTGESTTTVTTMAETGLEAPAICPQSPGFISTATEAAGHGVGVEGGLAQQMGGRDGTGGFAFGALGVGLSSTDMEAMDEIERACSQRCSALKEEELFVETLGKDESPVAV